MNDIFAVVEGGAVTNVLIGDGVTPPYAPSGAVIDITAVSPRPQIGWGYDGTAWTQPAPVSYVFSNPPVP